MSGIEIVYFVASSRDNQTGRIVYKVVNNSEKLPQNWRPVFGTGTLHQDMANNRMVQCSKGTWFKNEHKRRKKHEIEDDQYRKKLHEQYLKGYVKSSFSWNKYEQMLKA